jgi:hypothetical protein
MNRQFLYILAPFVLLLSCQDKSSTDQKTDDQTIFFADTLSGHQESTADVVAITTLFDASEFEDPIMDRLLAEIKICNPLTRDSIIDGAYPCSPKLFQLYTYNRKRGLEDAFLLQVRKGVNNFPYRRLLIFTRENGELVLMNGIIGYLVEKRKSDSGIDDLVVAVVDNIGGEYMRYDVLIRYENGKYHFLEALGDLEGSFEHNPELKAEATRQIGDRIKEKELIY